MSCKGDRRNTVQQLQPQISSKHHKTARGKPVLIEIGASALGKLAAAEARDPCPAQKVQWYQGCSARDAKSAGQRGKAQLHKGTVNQSFPAGQPGKKPQEKIDERTKNLGQNSLSMPMNSLLTELEPRDFLFLLLA